MRKELQKITLAHGNGGRWMHDLVARFRKQFSNPILNEMTDSAEIHMPGQGRLAFTTDSFVVKPLFFPGGDIGRLAVFGTVNDLAMKGARPLYLSLALILEQGLEISVLDRVIGSIKTAARQAGVKIVTGDVKVVERGAADQMYINTSGIGLIEYSGSITARARPGDVIIINGTIAEHGLAVFEARERLGFKTKIKSDTCALNRMVEKCLSRSRHISVLRDPTRGGLATALNEIASSSGLGIEVIAQTIPIRKDVRNMCDILGFDPLYMANEGKFLCFVRPADQAKILKAMGPKARVIGRVVLAHRGQVYLKTETGSSRILTSLEKDQLPRIC